MTRIGNIIKIGNYYSVKYGVNKISLVNLSLASKDVEWDEEYGKIPEYASGYSKVRVPVSQIASPFINPIKQERIEELKSLQDAGYELPPVILDGPGEVEEEDYPEEKYPFLDGHYPVVGEDVWFVHDGHHRVLLAIQNGEKFIDGLQIKS